MGSTLIFWSLTTASIKGIFFKCSKRLTSLFVLPIAKKGNKDNIKSYNLTFQVGKLEFIKADEIRFAKIILF
jgi:hypothetical protein